MERDVIMAKKKAHPAKKISATIVAIGVFLFIAVGSTLANMYPEDEPYSNQQAINKAYDDIIAKLPFDFDKTNDVPYTDKPTQKDPNKTTPKPSLADEEVEKQARNIHQQLPDVPKDEAYVEINDNIPMFSNADLEDVGEWEEYSPLDDKNRVVEANAMLYRDMMPSEVDERESLSHVKPTGWQQKRYTGLVDGSWLYNRSHLIGYQLTGQQDNVLNLMTGTRFFNVEGMLPFENYVANYIENHDVHVRYRITPLFLKNEKLARGVFMEGYSIEDDGKLAFHIFVPNKQPDIDIDYQDGSSKKAS